MSHECRLNVAPVDEAGYRQLPGGDIVFEGLRDLEAGCLSNNALLVLIASPRLRRLGIDVPDMPDVEHRLYERLEDEFEAGAHSKYNALIRRIVSFSHALERIQSDQIRQLNDDNPIIQT